MIAFKDVLVLENNKGIEKEVDIEHFSLNEFNDYQIKKIYYKLNLNGNTINFLSNDDRNQFIKSLSTLESSNKKKSFEKSKAIILNISCKEYSIMNVTLKVWPQLNGNIDMVLLIKRAKKLFLADMMEFLALKKVWPQYV